ncbi:MAG: NAD(P)/FAD-dependent oxidoreductase [Pseudomonadota bacterium]
MEFISDINRRTLLGGAAATAFSACAPAAIPAKDADILVIGAGLSGLNAARILAREGLHVLVIEASDRPGGRILTLDGLPGRPEAGGAQIGRSYARIHAEAADLGLKIVDPPRTSRDRALVLGDTLISQEEWALHPANPFEGPLAGAAPDSALFRLAAPNNPLQDVYAWREDAAQAYDVSAADFLRKQGLGDEALRVIDIALNATALDTYSMLNLYRTLTLFAQDSANGPPQALEGGAQRLPEAMAASLGDRVRYRSALRFLNVSDTGVEATTDQGELRADFAILALPFPALNRIQMNAPIEDTQSDAIAGLPYTPITQIHMTPKTRYWETDGAPAAMWTDGPLERVFAMPDRESGETVALNAWINGTGSEAASLLDDSALSDLARLEMRRLRNVDVDVTRIIRWDAANALSGGAYMHWAPGQISRWAGKMGRPAGRLYFAGEHLSHIHTGMEAAMETGERAAIGILEAVA